MFLISIWNINRAFAESRPIVSSWPPYYSLRIIISIVLYRNAAPSSTYANHSSFDLFSSSSLEFVSSNQLLLLILWLSSFVLLKQYTTDCISNKQQAYILIVWEVGMPTICALDYSTTMESLFPGSYWPFSYCAFTAWKGMTSTCSLLYKNINIIHEVNTESFFKGCPMCIQTHCNLPIKYLSSYNSLHIKCECDILPTCTPELHLLKA